MAKSKMIPHTGWATTHEDIEATDIEKWRHKVYEVEPDMLVLHEMANEHPKMTQGQFDAHRHSIETEGQKDPVITFRGKIVDGRHRWWALKELKANKILYVKMPHRSTDDEIRMAVGLSEVRRHQTPTQRAIHAYREGTKRGETFRETGARTGISHSQFSRCRFIEENIGSNMLNILWDGGKISVGDKSNLDSLSSIVAEKKRFDKEAELKANSASYENDKFKPDSPNLFTTLKYLETLSEKDFGYTIDRISSERKARANKEI